MGFVRTLRLRQSRNGGRHLGVAVVVRAGLRTLAFVGLFLVISLALQVASIPLVRAIPGLQVRGALVPQTMAIGEILLFIAAFVSTAVMAHFEKRPVWSYGFQKRSDSARRYFEGVILGVVAFGAVGALMYAFHGFRIDGFNLRGTQWLVYPLLWFAVMLLVGFAEEMLFRGYGLYALARGIGFWPAAIVMTLLFGAAHLTKDGENAVDIASILFIGLFLCFTLWRTGSLWLATGFHFAVDYMQFFVMGTPNGTAVPLGHLLKSSFPGPAWINGGALGTEASYFVFPVIALMFVAVHLLHGQPKWLQAPSPARTD